MITLTTDFGTSDHFVGAMKGVIAQIAPRARVVDITHEIAPYEIVEGAFVIAAAWASFPKRTIHVIVVDPGVGSTRRPILAEAGGHFFIAPDNGVLSMIFDPPFFKRIAGPRVRVISNPKLMAHHISRTFHGRDIFAPAAAHLARGIFPARFGKRIDDYIRLDTKPKQISASTLRGTILKADRFGNLITNFHRCTETVSYVWTSPFEMRVGSQSIRRLALTFSEAAIGELVVIEGSSGYLEIAANQASAAKILGCGARAPVELDIDSMEPVPRPRKARRSV
jgi:S-adenosyl-L-methionine hydrolase (adenosine-forming)